MKYILFALLLCAALSLSACADRRQLSSQASDGEAPPVQEEAPEVDAEQEKESTENETFESGVVNKKKDTDRQAEEENDFLLLVNPDHPLPEDFEIRLAVIQGPYQIDARIVEPARRMLEAAKADGIDLLVCSAYRPVDSQTRLFNNKVNEYVASGKTKEEATVLTAAMIAVPGTSEHHTGLAMDIVTPSYQNLDEGFAETDAFAWLDKHAADYGFILRYPKDKQEETGIIYESWHYRYVGPEIAKEIKEQGICLEEYLGEQ